MPIVDIRIDDDIFQVELKPLSDLLSIGSPLLPLLVITR